MSIESSLHTYLLSQSAITNIVGSSVWHDFIPQTVTTAAITWNLVSKDHYHTVQGAAGWCVAQYEIVSWSRDFVECQSLGEAVRTSLQGFHGTWGSFDIGFVTCNGEYIQTEPLANATDSRWYRVVSDWLVGYAESQPSF